MQANIQTTKQNKTIKQHKHATRTTTTSTLEQTQTNDKQTSNKHHLGETCNTNNTITQKQNTKSTINNR